MRVFPTVFLLFFTLVSKAQEKKFYQGRYEILDTVEQKNYYPSGELLAKGNVLVLRDTINVAFGPWQTFYKNGVVRDSVFVKDDHPIGRFRTNYPSGQLKRVVVVTRQGVPTADNFEATGAFYRKNGSLRGKSHAEGGGEAITFYNRKGKPIRFLDQHKKRTIKVSKPFKKQRHITEKTILTANPGQVAVLQHQNKKVRFKSGKLLNLKLKSQPEVLWHCQVEGFSENKMLLTKFSYDNGPQKNRTLKPDSVFVVPFAEIETLYIPEINRPDGPMAFYSAALTFLWEPPVLGLIFGFGPNPAGFLVFPAVGIPLLAYSKWRFRKTVPVAYPLDSWQLKPALN